jgi:inosine-uridine nucleoside N-ribohydrolase
MEGFHTFPDKWRESADKLNGVIIAKNPSPHNLTQHSVEWYHDILNKNKKSVVILAIGPLTNIGQLIQKYPNDVKKIKRIYIMGGALNVKGNLKTSIYTKELSNNYAEWNIWVDPLAAKIVFNSSIPITLVPLDATNQAKFTLDYVDKQKNKQIQKQRSFMQIF